VPYVAANFGTNFQERLGRSASDLLTDIRMTLAANELRKSSGFHGAVAEMVGYHSEAAFQRAFKQRMSVTPAQWRRVGAFARLAIGRVSQRCSTWTSRIPSRSPSPLHG